MNITERNESVCLVTCIEAGPLELQTSLLAATLRTFGGRLATARMLAIKPRWGPALSSACRRQLDDWQVEFAVAEQPGRQWWNHYFGKAKVVRYAANHSDAEQIVFLDSDILVTREPAELLLDTSTDFAACPGFDKGIASTGSDDPEDAMWSHACQCQELPLESLPWVTTTVSADQVRLYFNAGVFVFRRASGFADAWLKAYERLLEARAIRAADRGVHGLDEISAAVTVAKLGLRWQALSRSHNYSINCWSNRALPVDLSQQPLIHYHSALQNDFRDHFLNALRADRADLVALIERTERVFERRATAWTLPVYKTLRSLARKSYVHSCSLLSPPSSSSTVVSQPHA